MSEEILTIDEAIRKAKADFQPLKMSGINKYYDNAPFATLKDINDSIEAALHNNNLVIDHETSYLEKLGGGGYDICVDTRITYTVNGGCRSYSWLNIGKEIRTIQDQAAFYTWGRRQNLIGAFNLAGEIEYLGEGLDNVEDKQPISENVAKGVRAALEETKSDEAMFLKYIGVNSIEEITVGMLGKVFEVLEEKRRRASTTNGRVVQGEGGEGHSVENK